MTNFIPYDERALLNAVAGGSEPAFRQRYTSALAVNLYTGAQSLQHTFMQYFEITGFPVHLMIGKVNTVFRTSSSYII